MKEIYRSDLTYYRMKTLSEMEADYGSNWRPKVSEGWDKTMDSFLGKPLYEIFDFDSFAPGKLNELKSYAWFTIRDKIWRELWAITEQMVTTLPGMHFINRPIFKINFTPVGLKDYRLKNRAEFINAYGEKWRDYLEIPWDHRLDEHLGMSLDEFLDFSRIDERRASFLSGGALVYWRNGNCSNITGRMLELKDNYKRLKTEPSTDSSTTTVTVRPKTEEELSIFKQVVAPNPKDLEERYK